MVNKVSLKLAEFVEKYPKLKKVLMELEGPINLIYYIALGFLIGLILQYVIQQV